MNKIPDFRHRHIISTWVHNDGYTQKWLRRVTRQTKTQVICDCQHTLMFKEKAEKVKKLLNTTDIVYQLFTCCAFRMNYKNGKLVERKSHLANSDGVSSVSLLENISSLKSEISFKELFGVDVREILPKDSQRLEILEKIVKMHKEKYPEINFDDDYQLSFELKDDKLCNYEVLVVSQLKYLFNLPVYELIDQYNVVDTTHEMSAYTKNCVHYHVNCSGDDRKYITFNEHYKNRTIDFWLFDDMVVFKFHEGIDSW